VNGRSNPDGDQKNTALIAEAINASTRPAMMTMATSCCCFRRIAPSVASVARLGFPGEPAAGEPLAWPGETRGGGLMRGSWLLVALVPLVAGCTAGGDGSDSAATTGVPPPTVEVATLNALHGIDPRICPEETDFCEAPARLELLFDAIETAGCPDLVGLQEIGPRQTELVPERLPALCDGAYELVFNPEAEPSNTVDQEMVLTRLPVLDEAYVDLANFPWGAQWVRVDSDLGPIDFVTTHLASSANNPDCDASNCPQPLCEPGLETGTCQSRQLLEFLDERRDPSGIAIISGDLNQPVEHPRITTLLDAGFADAWTAAGNPECDPATGEGCTCCTGTGRTLDGLDDPQQTFSERIDFVLARAPDDCALAFDPDRTGPFAGEPVEPPVDGVVWASDHGGVQAAFSCNGTA